MATKALRLAGPGAVLAGRPAGVRHVYVGPLTPSGRYIPHRGQTVCRARTRRLQVLEPSAVGSMTYGARLCARCSACLLRTLPRGGQAEPLTTRSAFRVAHIETTKADVAFALELATTPAEVDQAAHLSLVLFTVAGCNDGFTDRGRTWRSLHQLVIAARTRVHGYPANERLRNLALAHREAGARARKQGFREIREERDRRVAAIGFNAATPISRNRRSPK